MGDLFDRSIPSVYSVLILVLYVKSNNLTSPIVSVG